MDNILDKIIIPKEKNVLVFGIGNMLKGDDAFGSVLAKRLKTKVKRLIVVDAEETPENHLSKLKKQNPNVIFLIDAIFCNLKPGEIRVFRPCEIINKAMFFTHNTTLDLIMNFIKEQTQAEVFLIGVQPKEVSIKEGLSRELAETLDKLEKWFVELDNVLLNPR
jgi:hydrogenase 3 maturation protease